MSVDHCIILLLWTTFCDLQVSENLQLACFNTLLWAPLEGRYQDIQLPKQLCPYQIDSTFYQPCSATLSILQWHLISVYNPNPVNSTRRIWTILSLTLSCGFVPGDNWLNIAFGHVGYVSSWLGLNNTCRMKALSLCPPHNHCLLRPSHGICHYIILIFILINFELWTQFAMYKWGASGIVPLQPEDLARCQMEMLLLFSR